MLAALYKFGVPLVDLRPPGRALEEVKRRAADRVIEVVKEVVKASSPTPVLVKVGDFSPLLLSAGGSMKELSQAMSRLRHEVLYLLNGVKLDNLLVSQFRG